MGADLMPYRRAVVLVAAFAMVGAVLQGHYVLKTIGRGIVKEDLSFLAVLVALICSVFFVTMATFF